MPDALLETPRQAVLAHSRDWDTRAASSELSAPNADDSPSREGAVGRAILRHQIRQLLDAPSARIPSLRSEVVRRLRSTRDPLNYVQELLDRCVAARSKGGLDFAIDILAQTGPLAVEFAEEFFRHDAQRWSTPTSAYHGQDDFWDILLRAAARATPQQPETLRLIRRCAEAKSRGLRDAAILALYDLKTPAAKGLLAHMAQQDPDPMIRRDAQELLEDFGS